MERQTIIFMGPQGSGKGTQATLLQKYLEEHDTRQVINTDTGTHFRKLAEGDLYTGKKVDASLRRGELQPSFLATYLWADVLVEQYTGEEHLLIQGSPRTINEAEALNGALEFYGRKAHMILLTVSAETARERLFGRGRSDDTEEGVSKRLEWFTDIVVPVIERCKELPWYEVIEVSAEPAVEEIQANIIRTLNF